LEAVKASGLRRVLVEVDDEGILAGAPYADFEQLIDAHSLRESQIEARLRIVRERPFYGPGAHLFMQLLEEEKSVLEVCRRMGMSYTKGRAIIANMEEQLGCQIIESHQGGRDGGYSFITEKGRELMRNYADFYSEDDVYPRELSKKYFAD